MEEKFLAVETGELQQALQTKMPSEICKQTKTKLNARKQNTSKASKQNRFLKQNT